MARTPRHQRRYCSAASAFLALALGLASTASAFTFTLDMEECFVENIKGGQSSVVGFVATRAYNTYSWGADTEKPEVEVKILGPEGQHFAGNARASADEIYFWTDEGGYHKVCFKNLEREHLKISVEILEYFEYEGKKGGHVHVKEAEMDDVHKELQRLQRDVMSTHHDVWYAFYLAQQHIELDERLSRRVVMKCLFQGFLLIICSVAQVLILKQLFEKRMRISRV